MPISLILIVGLFAGCSKNLPVDEEKKLEDYEINKEDSFRRFMPVMYDPSEGKQAELFKIVHISDAHVSSWSNGNNVQNPSNIKEAVRFANDPVVKINAMVATGDHISNHDKTSRETAINFLNIFTDTFYQNNDIPTFTATGNHDINMINPDFATYAISKIELNNLLTSKINYKINSPGAENYYYADLANPRGGTIRIIALDVTDQDNWVYSAQHNAILSQKQIDWLCHTALKKDMTELHSVIVLTHHPLPPDDEESFKKIIYSYYLYNWNMIPDIIEAFRTKQDLIKKYRNKLLVSDSVSVNVSFNNSPGEFICYLGGHLHTYLHYEVKSSSTISSILPKQLMFIANNMSASEKSETTHIERSPTGLQNNTFNLYAIDTKRKIIYVTFFGATSFYYPNVLTFNYL
ncbi:MAG: metallophosphoesterase [Tannerella sp.]|jgi:predicted MPP superfamily phosphohydrolase|nr:metallophosphoesterase [Tannerella sp.]